MPGRMALDAQVDRRPALRKSAPLISRQTVFLEDRESPGAHRDLSIPLSRRPGRDPVTRTIG